MIAERNSLSIVNSKVLASDFIYKLPPQLLYFINSHTVD